MEAPLITNDAVVLGILAVILGAVFATSSSEHPFFVRFYRYVPSLLLCYFLPAILGTAGIVSGETSKLYFVAAHYLLPASLVLLTVSADIPGVLRLGPKALAMFLTGTLGVVLGGPIAILIMKVVNPSVVDDQLWQGMATMAGSWIGGGANQAAMKEVFGVDEGIFGAFVAVDVIVANLWMGLLLYGAGRAEAIDRRTGADDSAIVALREKLAAYQARQARIPRLADTMTIAAVGLGAMGLSHLLAGGLQSRLAAVAGEDATHWLNETSLTSYFFWVIVIATTLGLALSFTRARRLEGVGASRIGSAFLYLLVATIGMKMDLHAVVENPWFFVIGLIWVTVHAGLLIVVARVIRAPLFFLAVGSQANIGGAASAPIVASAFHPTLAPVGVLLAVVGYALGTYCAWACAQIMRAVAL